MLILALSLALAAQSSEVKLSRTFDRCMANGEAGDGIQAAMQECVNTELAVQDGRLNQAYKMKMLALPTTKKPILRGMQRQWIADRDRRCGVAGDGSLDRFVATECSAKETASRTSWLETYR